MGNQMNLLELRNMTRVLSRDTNSFMFDDDMINGFINQAIDRCKQTPIFKNMHHLVNDDDVPDLLPTYYHYLLAIFASSRCFEFDERHYEGVDRRNEFENLFQDLMDEIESGNQSITTTITDSNGNSSTEELDTATYIDYIKDEYFNCRRKDSDVIKE